MRVFSETVSGQLHKDFRGHAVDPGTTDTLRIGRIRSKAKEQAALAHRQLHARLVNPLEVADAIAYLAKPSSGSTAGTNIAVKEGMDGLHLGPE